MDFFYVCHQCNTKGFFHQCGDGVFIRGFADNVRCQTVYGIEASGVFPEAGGPVIADDRIFRQILKRCLSPARQRMIPGCDDHHILVDDRDKLDQRLVFHIGSENDIVLFTFQPLDQRRRMKLVKAEGYVFILFLFQEPAYHMRNIVGCQRKYIGNIHMSFVS